eukprot:1680884-Ditylum_brightwellii.AAC.1
MKEHITCSVASPMAMFYNILGSICDLLPGIEAEAGIETRLESIKRRARVCKYRVHQRPGFAPVMTKSRSVFWWDEGDILNLKIEEFVASEPPKP